MERVKKTSLRSLVASLCLVTSSYGFSAAPGGPDCGWGNMLFEGDRGGIPHTVAYLTNGLSSFNAFFGIVLQTNGCTTDGRLSYGGTPRIGMNHILDELAQDLAIGSGEALNALAVALKIEKEDRPYFEKIMHDSFSEIFPHENVKADAVMASIHQVMLKDDKLKAYLNS